MEMSSARKSSESMIPVRFCTAGERGMKMRREKMKGRSQRTRQKRRQTGSSQAGQAEEDRDRYGRMRGKKQNRRSTLRDTSAQRQPAGCGGVTGGRGV